MIRKLFRTLLALLIVVSSFYGMSRATQSYEDMINKMFPERNPN